MNRCKTLPDALASVALGALFVAATALYSSPIAAQVQTQEEAAAGGRNFPVGTLRGRFMVVNWPEIQLDGQPDRLSPGARIRSGQNMLVMVGAIQGQKFLVNYTRDPAGLVSQVWILTPEEASIARESAERPFLNFWPFVAASRPHDDGKTPFDQLPKY